jgi:hypothetical protein
MASSGKKKTTMAKLTRESRLRERRAEKEARKRLRKDAAANPQSQFDAQSSEFDGPPSEFDGPPSGDEAVTSVAVPADSGV